MNITLPTKPEDVAAWLSTVAGVTITRDDLLNKRNHHYVAQFYLRYFSADGRRIYMYDKKLDRITLVGIKDVAVNRDFYLLTPLVSLATTTDQRELNFQIANALESALFSKCENQDSPAMHRLIASVQQTGVGQGNGLHLFSSDDLLRIVRFVALSFLRTMEYRAVVAEGYRKAREITSTRVSLPEQVIHLASLQAFGVFRTLVDNIWVIGRAPSGTSFITSDNPVVRFPECLEDGRVLAKIIDRGMQVGLPLDSNNILRIYDREHFAHLKPLHGQVELLSVDEVGLYNEAQVKQSYRQVFGFGNDFSLAKRLCDAEPEFRDTQRDRLFDWVTEVASNEETNTINVQVNTIERVWATPDLITESELELSSILERPHTKTIRRE